MSISIDENKATDELFASYQRAKTKPTSSPEMLRIIEVVFGGKGCITYQYIVFTALLAKATNPRIDPLSLQVEDQSDGAYAPRMLCKHVVFPFQKKWLENVIDGANNDPLVNNPGRHLRLDKETSSRGDPKKALYLLTDYLPTIETQQQAREELDCLMTYLLQLKAAKQERRKVIEDSVTSSSTTELRQFMSDLLDQGFGGNALVLVASALYRLQYPEDQGYAVIPHPVNQPGSSKRQLSDLDLMRDGKPFIGIELKDKPFSEDDVRRAAKKATEGGLSSLLFISGRSGSLSDQTVAYFDDVRLEYASKGVYVGLCGIDAFMDVVLASQQDIDVPATLLGIYDQVVTNAGTPETQMWVYAKLSGK